MSALLPILLLNSQIGRLVSEFVGLVTSKHMAFRNRRRRRQCTSPNFAKLLRFSSIYGASVPKWLEEMFEGLDDDPEIRRMVAVTQAADQCQALREQGVNEFHFYTLNRADLTYAICRILGLRPTAGGASQPTRAACHGYDGRQPTTVKRKQAC